MAREDKQIHDHLTSRCCQKINPWTNSRALAKDHQGIKWKLSSPLCWKVSGSRPSHTRWFVWRSKNSPRVPSYHNCQTIWVECSSIVEQGVLRLLRPLLTNQFGDERPHSKWAKWWCWRWRAFQALFSIEWGWWSATSDFSHSLHKDAYFRPALRYQFFYCLWSSVNLLLLWSSFSNFFQVLRHSN